MEKWKICGHGVLTFPARNPKRRLEGEWTGDQLEFGTLFYRNGSVYSGQFKDNLCNRYGTFMEDGGKLKQGIWINDQYIEQLRASTAIQSWLETKTKHVLNCFRSLTFPEEPDEIPQAADNAVCENDLTDLSHSS